MLILSQIHLSRDGGEEDRNGDYEEAEPACHFFLLFGKEAFRSSKAQSGLLAIC